MFRTTASSVLSKTTLKAARSNFSSSVAVAKPAAAALGSIPDIRTSLVAGPVFIPGYDFLGRPLDNENASPQPSQSSQSSTATTTSTMPPQAPVLAHTAAKAISATTANIAATVAPMLPGWLQSMPAFLKPREGTTYYEQLHHIAVGANHRAANPGFLQCILYGTPEHVLLARLTGTVTTEAVKSAETEDVGKTDESVRDGEELSDIVDDAVETMAGSVVSAKDVASIRGRDMQLSYPRRGGGK